MPADLPVIGTCLAQRDQRNAGHRAGHRPADQTASLPGARKDWQQSQTDLLTAQNTVRSDEIALHAVRSRLRILGKTDAEIASLEAQPTQKLNPEATVPAPIGGTITQRQTGQFIAKR